MLYVQGDYVISQRPRRLGGNWRRKLGDLEMKVLRFLYAAHPIEEVVSTFGGEAARRVLDDFARSGLTIQYRDWVISVVNDRDRLLQAHREHQASAPARSAEPATRDEALAVVS